MTGAQQTPLVTTWWGHSSVSATSGSTTVATDPLFGRLLFALHRKLAVPPDSAAHADVVLVSHLHYDHLHLPSLRRFGPEVPIVVPRGAPALVRGLGRLPVVEAEPGDRLTLAGVEIDVLPAHHDGRRSDFHRGEAPSLGFRFVLPPDGAGGAGRSVWFPGDTGLRSEVIDLAAADGSVDLALAPIGGWGPSLGEEHLDPEEAAQAIDAVGATWSLAVHYGTYWPLGLRRLRPGVHRHLFLTPPQRFHDAVREQQVATTPLTPAMGETLTLQ